MRIRSLRVFLLTALTSVTMTSIVACQKSASQALQQSGGGSTLPASEKELLATKGQPAQRHEVLGSEDHQSETLIYSDNESYQISRGHVQAKFRDPLPEEESLQYWRHQWQGKEQEDRAVAGESNHGIEVTRMLYSRPDHKSVVYRVDTGAVVRVIDHGAP